jgi:hypothetical protein
MSALPMQSPYDLVFGQGPQEPVQIALQQAQAAPQPQFTAMSQPIDPAVQQIMQPAKSPEEVESRKAGWLEVMQKAMADPNISRALMFFGATAAGPRNSGESGMGHFGRAALTGRTAYDFGLEAERNRALRESKERREQEAHTVNVESTRASTEGTRARTAATQLDTDFNRQTMQDRVGKIKTEAEAASLALSKAKSQEEVDRIKRGYEKKRNEILAGVPDATIRKSVEDELNKQGIENKLRSAQAASAGASAAYYGSKAGEQALENKDLQAMTPEERAQYRTRTGKFQPTTSSSASAMMAGETVFGRLYEQQNPKPSEPEKHAEWTSKRAKYIEDRLTALKRMDGDKQRLEAYKLWQIDGGENSGKTFQQFSQELGLSFTGEPGKPGAGATKYEVGKVYTGKTGRYKYLGGPESDAKSWEKQP